MNRSQEIVHAMSDSQMSDMDLHMLASIIPYHSYLVTIRRTTGSPLLHCISSQRGSAQGGGLSLPQFGHILDLDQTLSAKDRSHMEASLPKATN